VLIGGQLLTPPPPTFHTEYHVSTDQAGSTISPELVEKTDSEIFMSPDADFFEAPDFDDEIFKAPVVD
jgi:hypothetical protein